MWYIVLGICVVFIPTMSYLLMRGAWEVRKKELLRLRAELTEMKTKDEKLTKYLEEIENLLEN